MPAGGDGNEERVAVGRLVLQDLCQQFQLVLQMGVFLTDLFALPVKFIGQPFQKQHPKDEFLEFRGVHLAAQDLSGLEQEGFQLGEGDFLVGRCHTRSFGSIRSSLTSASGRGLGAMSLRSAAG